MAFVELLVFLRDGFLIFDECDMTDHQVRRWDAWHHHMALVMLGTFSHSSKIQGRKQWPMLPFNDLLTALAHLLPRRQITTEDLVTIIDKRLRLRQRAKKSRSRRAQAAME